ncbi:winged helix-turn-helix transcriptional regulator [Pseudomonas extremorientalis]|uniref:winged helix-turn-helix transcriptional regulator n=1 Tax=Pseudomonas extremorientalis TaxID=169669 RepID=UPI00211C6F86|nr:helix-turn-helix domain-containing protein [Pseudomonas extremorientalis]UUN86026.1 helix-turn-helix transcriptional regulator [Pseudomonas extremorientalis]
MQRKSLISDECPIARSLERVGEWWSILIMRDALHGLRRFDEFSRSLGIAPNMLTRRLNALVEAGMLERRAYSERPPRYEYVPTAKGEDFGMVLISLVAWGNRHYAEEGASVELVERKTGRPVQPTLARADGQLVAFDQCVLQAGPAASAGMRERLALLGAKP